MWWLLGAILVLNVWTLLKLRNVIAALEEILVRQIRKG